MVTVTVNAAPLQEEVAGVTVYVAVWAEPVVFTSVPVILDPEPEEPPVIPPVTTGADQV